MPKIREGYRQFATQVPADLLAGLESLAAANGRSAVDELAHAIQRHLSQPPTVQVTTPPLDPATVTPGQKRGRKRAQ